MTQDKREYPPQQIYEVTRYMRHPISRFFCALSRMYIHQAVNSIHHPVKVREGKVEIPSDGLYF